MCVFDETFFDIDTIEERIQQRKSFELWRPEIEKFAQSNDVEVKPTQKQCKSFDEMSKTEQTAYMKIWNEQKKSMAVRNGLVVSTGLSNADQALLCLRKKNMIKGVDYFELTSFKGSFLCYAYTKKAFYTALSSREDQYISDEDQDDLELCYYEVCDLFKTDEQMAYMMYKNGFTGGYTHFMSLAGSLKEVWRPTKKRIYDKLYPSLRDFCDFVHEQQKKGTFNNDVKKMENKRDDVYKELYADFISTNNSNSTLVDGTKRKTVKSCETN